MHSRIGGRPRPGAQARKTDPRPSWRSPVLLAGVLVVAAAAAGCSAPASDPSSSSGPTSSTGPASNATSSPPAPRGEPIRLFFDFGGEPEGSGNLTGWGLHADVPDDPNNPGHKVSWNVTACSDAGWESHVHIQAHPVHSACFAIDGRQSDGTVWIARTVHVMPGASYRANVSVRAWGEESANTVADLVLRLGNDPATSEDDFAQGTDRNRSSIRRPLDMASGWSLYGMTWNTGPVASGVLHLEVGVSALFPSAIVRYLDAVTVDLEPA